MRLPSSFGFRPTFVLRSPLEERVLAKNLQQHMGDRARAAGHHLLLSVPSDDQRPWSPWLFVDVRPGDEPDGGSDLVCRFSPHPSLWTGVMLAELALLSTVFFAACFAFAQHVAKQPPSAWWVTAGAAIAAVALWIGAQLGQRLAGDQMKSLYTEVATVADANQHDHT